MPTPFCPPGVRGAEDDRRGRPPESLYVAGRDMTSPTSRSILPWTSAPASFPPRLCQTRNKRGLFIELGLEHNVNVGEVCDASQCSAWPRVAAPRCVAFIHSSRPCDHAEDGGAAFPLRSQGRPGRSKVVASCPEAALVASRCRASCCVCVTTVPQSKHRARYGGPQASRGRKNVCASGGTARQSGRSRRVAFRSSFNVCCTVFVFAAYRWCALGRLERGGRRNRAVAAAAGPRTRPPHGPPTRAKGAKATKAVQVTRTFRDGRLLRRPCSRRIQRATDQVKEGFT